VATWQFDFHLIPASSVATQFSVVPIVIPAEEYDRVNWWEGLDLLHDIEADLSGLLPRGRSWDSKQETWGEEDGDRFDLLRDGHRIAEVFGRLDIRALSLPLVNRVVEIARRRDLLIVTEDRHVLRPSVKELLGAIHRSRSFAFVTDPEAFLKKLANTE
jgi:hypothetical protein